jgi:hypothetical protein
MIDDLKQKIAALDAEWDPEAGFLGLLREGHFDSLAFNRYIGLLKSIDLGDGGLVGRRLVAVLWMAPMFIERQERRFESEDRMVVINAGSQVEVEVMRILGGP